MHKHRHVLVVPIMVMIVGMFMIYDTWTSPLRADLVHDAHVSNTHVMQLSATLFARAITEQVTFNAERFDRGSVILMTTGIGSIDVPGGHIMFLPGTVYLNSSDYLTIAALTTPVLFRADSGAAVVIPQGYHYESREVLSTLFTEDSSSLAQRTLHRSPTHFLDEQRALGEEIADAIVHYEEQEKIVFKAKSHWLQLPKAHRRAREEHNAAFWHERMMTMAPIDPSEIQRMLSTMDVADPIVQRDVLRFALTQEASSSTVLLALSPFVKSVPDLWLLFALYEPFRNVAVAMVPERTVEDHVLWMFALPQSDIFHEPMSSIVMQRWKESVIDFVQKREESTVFMRPFVEHMRSFIEQCMREGYPLRADLYRSVLADVIASFPGILSPELSWTEEFSPPIHADKKVIFSQDESVLPPDILERRAYEMLQSMGASFRVDTRLEPLVSSQRVAVHAIVFGDQSYDCTVDITTSEIRDLLAPGDKRPRPFPLSQEAFMMFLSTQ